MQLEEEILEEVRALRSLLMKAPTQPPQAVLEHEGLKVDRLRRQVWRGEREIVLTRREFDVLVALISNPEYVVSRKKLGHLVWGPDRIPTDNLIDRHICALRYKLNGPHESRLVQTVMGVGYRLKPTTEGNKHDAR